MPKIFPELYIFQTILRYHKLFNKMPILLLLYDFLTLLTSTEKLLP